MAETMAEAAELREQAHQWLLGLVASGVPNLSIATALLVALLDMMLAAQGKEATLRWLGGQLQFLEQHGDEWVGALRREP